MRHSSTVEPSRPTTANGTGSPHPVLSTALGTLDIQLEAELARYRRSKTGARVARSTKGQSPRPLDLIAVSARSVPSDSPAAASTSEMVVATGAATGTASNLAATSSELLRSAQAPETDLAESEVELDDYLASSEELLRSLSEEEAKVQAERGFMRSLVTPLGVGSMLLLLLSSAMFGYVVTNPTSLSGLFASRNEPAQPSPDLGAIVPDASGGVRSAAPQPNLANKEFKDLNLNTLGTLKSGATSRPIAAPSASPKQPQTPPVAASTPAPQGSQSLPLIPVPPRQSEPAPDPATQTYQPEPVRDTTPAPPVPEREAPAPQPAPPSADSEAYRYKVVAPYDGDRSLENTKKIVPDAFVTNAAGKAETQVGAHSSAADAEMQVQELRRQGVQAEVQKR